jgi:phosphoribosylglycinamide formyltransferase-1
VRIVVLASGRGSNLEALIDAQRDARLPISIVAVFSDRADARALEVARAAGIAAIHVDPRAFGSRRDFDDALFAAIAEASPDLIVLAGFMRILDAEVFAPWLGRIINIHPSLLPKYPGLHTHRRALEAGERLHGASVHFVSAELDGGPVLGQTRLEVRTEDTPQSLAGRLLPQEHRLLVACVGLLASGRVCRGATSVHLDGLPMAKPLQFDEGGARVDDTV